MNKFLLALAVGLSSVAFADHVPGHHDHGHDHGARLDVSNLMRIQYQIVVTKDSVDGLNLILKSVNTNPAFRFAPEKVGQPHSVVEGMFADVAEGHAHLLINGHKVARLYGPAFHIPSSMIQTVVESSVLFIDVSFNSNDHQQFVQNGQDVIVQSRVALP